jgi:hypothetical protein
MILLSFIGFFENTVVGGNMRTLEVFPLGTMFDDCSVILAHLSIFLCSGCTVLPADRSSYDFGGYVAIAHFIFDNLKRMVAGNVAPKPETVI